MTLSSAPVSSPPAAAKATPEAQALAAASREPAAPYCYPSLNLFNANRPEDEAGAVREMKHNADVLVNTLDSFGVKTKILDICRGPSVTRYELQPQAGIKVSRITSLADDIALNLATAGVRIEAPIPGKPAVGIEVPNKIRATVNIRSVFEAQSYINMRSPLTMALGKDIAGQAQVADLCKMPHLLIAGSTGSGKSVCVNSIIISFLFRSSPEDVKLILIDPKVVELAEYNGIPHLLMPVVTEPRKAAGALGTAVAEMEKILENTYRNINIGLVNELAMLCNEMGISMWEVVDAAKTKPYGFQAFYPGPGLGGHCIPLDPYYLSWKAREYGFHTSMIESSMMINDKMPEYCVDRAAKLLNRRAKKAMNGSKVLVLGVAYKQDIDDYRESPALRVIEELEKEGAEVVYFDPWVKEYKFKGQVRQSIPALTEQVLKDADLVMVTTAHTNVDYDMVQKNAALIFDSKNAMKNIQNRDNIEVL